MATLASSMKKKITAVKPVEKVIATMINPVTGQKRAVTKSQSQQLFGQGFYLMDRNGQPVGYTPQSQAPAPAPVTPPVPTTPAMTPEQEAQAIADAQAGTDYTKTFNNSGLYNEGDQLAMINEDYTPVWQRERQQLQRQGENEQNATLGNYESRGLLRSGGYDASKALNNENQNYAVQQQRSTQGGELEGLKADAYKRAYQKWLDQFRTNVAT